MADSKTLRPDESSEQFEMLFALWKESGCMSAAEFLDLLDRLESKEKDSESTAK